LGVLVGAVPPGVAVDWPDPDVGTAVASAVTPGASVAVGEFGLGVLVGPLVGATPATSTNTGSDEAELLLASRTLAWLRMRPPFCAFEFTRTLIVMAAGLLFCTETLHVTVLPLMLHEPVLALALT
jgi:hypothetical protein